MADERRKSLLTDHDREFLNTLVDQQTSSLKSDIRWMKLLSSAAITATGAALAALTPVAKDLHGSIDELRAHMSTLELDSKQIKEYHAVIQRHKWDHLRCHFKAGKGALK